MSSKREALERELEETRTAYHELIARLPDRLWRSPSGIPEWTVVELAVHLTTYALVVPVGVKAARTGSAPGGVTGRLLRNRLPDWLNRLQTRLAARGKSRADALAAYDRSHERLLALLQTVGDGDWDRRTFIIGRDMSIEDLFRNQRWHFDEHRPQIEAALSGAGRDRV